VNSPVPRRLALIGCALVATATLASCSTFSDNDAVARVGDVELSRDDVDVLLDLEEPATPATDTDGSVLPQPTAVSGDEMRSALTKWIRVALLETKVDARTDDEIASPTDLDSRLSQGQSDFAMATGDAGRTAYEQGVNGSETVCLAAIPVDNADAVTEVMDAINGGMSFADAAAQYSTDPDLAKNGGVILGSDGGECLPKDNLNTQIVDALDGKAVGTPVPVTLDTFSAVIELRPYDEIGDDAKRLIARAAIPEDAFVSLIADADVYVDPYYGYWDAATASVLPLGGGATNAAGG